MARTRDRCRCGIRALVSNLHTAHGSTMTTRRTLTVSITAEQDALVRACLNSGRYASASEVVRAALRLLSREEANDIPALRSEVVEVVKAAPRA
ncbi:type II toxin-antitoxin system ParD family antitoxin [Methylobacterium sp. P5_C11]